MTWFQGGKRLEYTTETVSQDLAIEVQGSGPPARANAQARKDSWMKGHQP